MKMSVRAERGIIRKSLDSSRQMMHVALVVPTDISGRAMVADVKGFLLEVEHFHHSPFVQVNSFQYLQLHPLYEGTYLVPKWQWDGKP